jgi:ferredoxin, 2Fe-2S
MRLIGWRSQELAAVLHHSQPILDNFTVQISNSYGAHVPKVHFILYDGSERTVDANVGDTAMQIAIDNAVPGIIGDCGGNRSCATCHGYVDPAWADKLTPMTDDEAAILDGAADVATNSRLTCQITLTAALDGIVIRLPLDQV